MKHFRTILAAGLVLGVASAASAQTANQTVTFSVTDVNTVAVSADPAALSAAAGAADATDATTTYDVTTNSTVAKKITGIIDLAMPTGTTLSVNLGDPDGASAAVSTGAVVLTASGQDLVTGITQLAATAKPITYVLHADVTATAATNLTRTVTFTIQ
jgi:ribosomal protein L7/L12